jgi:predicted Zn-dependent peptidase
MIQPLYSKLKNGLEICLIPNQNVSSIAVQIRGLAGSIEETTNVGAAHLTEHWVLKGSKNYPTEAELTNLLTKNGGRYFAVTSRSDVVFGVHTVDTELETCLQALSDVFYFPKFDAHHEPSLKNSIKSEISRIYDNPEKLVTRFAYQSMFEDGRLHKFNLGSEKDLESLTPADVIDFHENFYTNNRFVLVISGKFDVYMSLKWLEKYFAVSTNESTRQTKTPKYRKAFTEKYFYTADIKLDYLRWDFQAPEFNDPDKYSCIVLAKVLSTILKQHLQIEGLSYRNAVDYFTCMQYAFMSFFVSYSNIYTDQVDGAINKITTDYPNFIDETIVVNCKKAVIAQLIFGMEKTTTVGNFYAELLLNGLVGATFESEIEKLQKVTTNSVLAQANKIFASPSYKTILTKLTTPQLSE